MRSYLLVIDAIIEMTMSNDNILAIKMWRFEMMVR